MSNKKKKGKYSTAKAAAGGHRALVILVVVLSVLFAAALAALGALFFWRSNEPDVELTDPTVVTTTAPVQTTTPPTTTAATTETPQPPETTQPTTEPTTEPTTAPTTPPTTAPTTPPTKPPAPPPPPPTKPPVIIPTPTEPEKVVITLPYVVPGSSLVIQKVAPYEGAYLEDGTDATVSNVAMALLYNAGSEAVEYSKITMKYDDKTLQFEASAIPAGGVVVAQAVDRSSCATGDLLECTADVATLPTLDKAEDKIKIEDNGNNSLTVTNLTDKDIVTVRIFYKYYMEDTHAYVGGITYTAKISNLKANESIVITPSHYASGASKVMMVRTYDEDV